MILPLEWFRAEALRQELPLDEADLKAIAAFVNGARTALDTNRPHQTEGLEPTGPSCSCEGQDASDG